ncbi:YcaO-like family protein [Pseudomonas antarctica]|uniref:YcaO-like family protein n=1 Tax=Pseudomonas antarctica TaxID=219572 RepID=UPI00387B8A8C
MKLVNGMQKPDLPDTILFQPAGVLTLPNAVEVSDSLSVNGSGVGGGSNSVKTALGEYFERRHFYREVISERRGCLNESLAENEVCRFAQAFLQTASRKVSVREIETYEFALTEVLRTSDFTQCFIPTVCISLSSHSTGQDSVFYPLRDTCGCSFHWNSDFALLGAIKESLERQMLVRFWLTKHCRFRVSTAHVGSLLGKRAVRHLYQLLVASGEVTFLDITDTRFPGACVLAVYGQSKGARHVKYCAGMSYASELAVALEKSLLELWQTFRFMDLFKATDSEEAKLEDSYIRYFLDCNAYETYQEITDVIECGGVGPEQRFTLSGFMTVLKRMGVSGYFYFRRERVNEVSCVFVKYMSPDLFFHMNNSKNFNLDNKYSEVFRNSVRFSRLDKMVPFP